MSLIQQALERTHRAQETRTTTPAAPKPYERDILGEGLERELIQVQQAYARRRKRYGMIALAVLTVFFIAGLFYAGTHGKKPSRGVASSRTVVAAPSPVRIYSGTIYRLTGITDLGGNRIAVINGRLLGVGDVLDGKASIKSIGQGAVVLDLQGQEVRLTL